jgi:hypothetical protein
MAKGDVIKGKKRRGEATLFKPEYTEQVEKLCRSGSTDKDLALFFNVSVNTIDNWKKRYPDFFLALLKGKQEADANVAEALYRNVIGFDYCENQPVKLKRAFQGVLGSLRMQMFDHGWEEASCSLSPLGLGTARGWRNCRLILAAFRYVDIAAQDWIGLGDHHEVLCGLGRRVAMQLRGSSSSSMHDKSATSSSCKPSGFFTNPLCTGTGLPLIWTTVPPDVSGPADLTGRRLRAEMPPRLVRAKPATANLCIGLSARTCDDVERRGPRREHLRFRHRHGKPRELLLAKKFCQSGQLFRCGVTKLVSM